MALQSKHSGLETKLKHQVNSFTLSFHDSKLTERFSRYATSRSLSFVRISLFIAMGLYIVFSFLDPLIMPDMIREITLIRIASILFFAGILYGTYTGWGFKNFQFLMCVAVLFASFGIIRMILLSEATGYYLYHDTTLILVIIYAHNLLRLRFIFATFITWAVILIYVFTTIWLVSTPYYIHILYIYTIFFLIASNILGMFASYWLEYFMKAVFWKESKLDEKTKQLEAEFKRKTQELEAARDIQLGMLPQEPPHLQDYQFSFSMQTASEVGGDYYDYVISDDKTVTFAIGDATGHGLQASAIVTAMKLLFSEHAGQTELTKFLKRSSRSISLIGFRKIYLAFAIGRLQNNKLEFAGAGMPPALVYRSKNRSVEQVSLKGFPLGSNVIYPYQKTELYLEPGDMVLLMTDGFPELANSKGDMIGYESVIKIFSNYSEFAPEIILKKLNIYCSDWLSGNPQNDDITFFALKRTL